MKRTEEAKASKEMILWTLGIEKAAFRADSLIVCYNK